MVDQGVEVRRNLRNTFEQLAHHSPEGGTVDFGHIAAVSAGVPTPTFNRIFVFEPFDPAELNAALEWFAEREEPFWITATIPRREAIQAALSDIDVDQSETPQPGMARPLSADVRVPDTPAEIHAVTERTEMDAWVSVAESVFDFSPETSRLITPPSVLGDEELGYFLGRVNSEPAACGILYLDDSVAGVYVIGVKEAFRRQGLGEAMTWSLLQAGQERGADRGVLQSTEMGYPLYDQMGFDTEVEFWHFALQE